jgi:hypothetical protein
LALLAFFAILTNATTLTAEELWLDVIMPTRLLISAWMFEAIVVNRTARMTQEKSFDEDDKENMENVIKLKSCCSKMFLTYKKKE